MRLLCTGALAAAYLTLAPVLAVETARSYQASLESRQAETANVSVIYKSDTPYWPAAADADRG